MAKQENINVVARIRPFSDWIGKNQKSCVATDKSNSTIAIKTTVKDKRYEVNKVFDEASNQEEIYENVGKPIIQGFVEGINGTIFAYGQTGSGKTYTMIGPEAADGSSFHHENSGILPRALKNIFELLSDEINSKPEAFKYSMKCSFLELYNERLFDLLQDKDSVIKIQGGLEQIALVGAAEFEVTSFEDCMELLSRGWNQRKVAETSMNRESSRSHAVFMLTLTTEHSEGLVNYRRSSRLNLVDLAGSERQGHTNNTGDRLREAGNINKSLSTLARVIRTLASSTSTQFIPYRDSQLTFLLKDSLGGNARGAVVVNIHPNLQFAGETISTLDFAENVKKVKNTAVVNEATSCEDIDKWKAEIERLRNDNRELQALKDDNEKLKEENQQLSEEKHILVKKISSLESRLNAHVGHGPTRFGFAAHGNTFNDNGKERRQTVFIPKSNENENMDYGMLSKKFNEVEATLAKEERKRSECEIEINRLHQKNAELGEQLKEFKNVNNEKANILAEKEKLEERLLQAQHHIQELEDEVHNEKKQSSMDYDMILEKLIGVQESLAEEERKRSECEIEINRLQDMNAVNDERLKEFKDMEVVITKLRREIQELVKQRDVALNELATSNGHSNHAQKIQYVEKLKNEVTALKNENAKLKGKKKVKHENKENDLPSNFYGSH